MKSIVLIVLVCSLNTALFSQENKRVEISKEVINNLQKNEFAKTVLLFDQTMKDALPEKTLKLVWEDLNSKCGAFQKYSTITEGKIQNYEVTYILCHFANLNLQMKTVFNDKNQVAGLFFIPENQK